MIAGAVDCDPAPLDPPFTAIVFDVLGTVVDERGSMITETERALSDAGLPAAQGADLTEHWLATFDADISRRARREAAWASSDTLRLEALQRALTAEQRAALGPDRTTRLAGVGRRLKAWPDSVAGLDALAAEYTVIALTNGSLSQSTEMSSHAGLRWHALLTSDLVRAFKPDPQMYRLPIERLELDPTATLFAAAHPWDLRAAAGHGYRTAFIDRPDAEAPESCEFDVQVRGLAGLVTEVVTSDR